MHSPDEIAIDLRDIWVKYASDRKRTGANLFGTSRSRQHAHQRGGPATTDLWALQGLSVSLRKGTATGLIGRNGAGKSTLLRVIAGILPPHRGSAHVTGRVTPLLALSGSLAEPLTGWENLRRMAILRQVPTRQREAVIQDAGRFSGLAERLEDPVRTFSSGMKLRLAFSLATTSEPEILLLDEIVGTGDKDFQARSSKRIRDLVSGSATVVVASHSLSFIEEMCPHVLWIEGGIPRMAGETPNVLSRYRESREQ